MKKTLLYAGILGTVLMTQAAYADSDSSADVAEGFVATLEEAPGLILRVNINQQGQEDTGSAVMKVATQKVQSAAQLQQAFDKGKDTSSQPQITQKDIEADSSTFGFFPIRFSFGWQQPYYYSNYYPNYYYGGYYYNYGRPYYHYNNWGHHHRYYYYPRRYW